ncbi:Aste57867_209 [Aphanomyces stellatus]|uniref:Aste57867_209 protein n=1 Tax=Aphanomyces stellatus TaxID=120398 RepID=A0A485K287_9STRA|nr:hypothetical protein As57867_000209 [Aphanomyces stellatus]VFT77435.1 Aste57867_209 [Aphanomyces stellatus]
MSTSLSEEKPLLPKFTSFPDVDDVQEVVVPQEGTVLTSYLGLMSTMAGACILTLPSTVAAAHLLPASISLLATAALGFAGCVCLALACEGSGASSFETLIERLRCNVQLFVVRSLIVMLLFGAVVMYIVIATDMLQPFVPFFSRFVFGGLFVAICLPLCLPDTVAALEYSNSVVVACVLYIVVVLTWQASSQPAWPAAPTTPVDFHGIAYTVPIQALSYCMHLNVPQVYGELTDKSQMTLVSSLVLGSGFIMYLVASIAGYVCFAGAPPANILTGFAADNAAINGVRIALGICMVCKTPITYQPLRGVIESMAPHGTPKIPFRLGATAIFLVACWILAVTASDLSYVMDWVGATAGILLAFAFPGLFLWEMLAQHPEAYSIAVTPRYRALAVFMMVMGVSLSALSIAKMIWFE